MGLFEIFLTELTKALQCPPLLPDTEGACLVLLEDERIPLLFELDDSPAILLSSALTSVPGGHRTPIYEASLIGNNSLEETLSIKPDEEILYLHRRFHPKIQAHELKLLLDFFLKNREIWKKRVATQLLEPPVSPTLPPLFSIPLFPYKF